MPVSKPKTYNPAVDFLRFVSILAVIMIHTTTKVIQAVSGNLHLVPWTLFLNQASRFAVPLFFLISGFVLELSSPPDLNYWVYLKKRLSRIFVPYLIWTAVYSFLVYPTDIYNFPRALFFGTASYQLYFIPSLLIFYLIFPLLHHFYKFIANRWLLITLGIVQLFFLAHDYYLGSYPIFYPLNIALLNFYVFILGVVASHYQPALFALTKKYKYLLFTLTGLLVIYVFYEGGSRYYSTGNYLAFYSQWRPSIFFYTLFLSSALYYLFSRIKISPTLVKSLSSLSFFVFFFHIIVLEIVWNTIATPLFSRTSGLIVQNFWFDPLFFLTVSILSFSVASLCHRIPFLSKLTG